MRRCSSPAAQVNRLQRRYAVGASADEGYWNVVQGLDRLSVLVTGTTQRGSLPAYLGTILVVVLALPGTILITRAPWPDEWRPWDTPVQAIVGVVILIAAGMALRIRQRLSVVLVVGVTGYGVAVLFALQGAPDLALTQFLVETLTLVTFVLVLRKLPKDITERHLPRERIVRGVIAVAMGALMAGVGAAALDVRTATPVSADYPQEAYAFGGGKNIVNVILVDIRAWDTLGEISLLVVAATGVASLVFLRGRTGGVDRLEAGEMIETPSPAGRAPRRRWLAASATLPPERRSVVLEVITRILFHTILVFSLYLLFSGHNEPGGGFAGGLVAGLALVLRYLAGGRYELGEAAPVDPGAAARRRAALRRRHRGGRPAAGCRGPADSDPRDHSAGPRRGEARDVALLRHGGLPDRRRPGTRRAAQPRRRARPPGGAGRPDRGPARRGDRPMTPTVVLPVIIGGLYAAGVYLLLDRSLTRVLVGFLLLGNATNLLLLSTGGPAGLAPILGYAEPEEMSDPLPQALILTAIVITFGVTAFILAMIHRSWALARNEAVGTDEEDRRVAGRHDTDADELDPDDLAPDDRPAGHADSLSARRMQDEQVGLGRPQPAALADDIDIPLGGGGR